MSQIECTILIRRILLILGGICLFPLSASADIAFSPSGKFIATSTRDSPNVIIWDAATGKQLRVIKAYQPPAKGAVAPIVNGLAISPGGKQLAVIVGLEVRLFDPATGAPAGSLKPRNPNVGKADVLQSIGYSPTGRTIATGDIRRMVLWNPATRRELGAVEHLSGFKFGFTPDGSKVLSVADPQKVQFVHLTDALTGKEVGFPLDAAANAQKLFGGSTCPVQFSADGKRLLVAASVYDWPSLNQVVNTHNAQGLALSSDGRFLALCRSKKALLLDAATGKEMATTDLSIDAGIRKAVWSPDGKTVAIEDSGLKLWDVSRHVEASK